MDFFHENSTCSFLQNILSQGFLAFGHDHLGHGLSSGDRATIGDLELYVDDIVCHTLRYKALYRSLPCFIFGHSMGGLLALRYLEISFWNYILVFKRYFAEAVVIGILLFRAVQRNPKMFRGMVLEGPLIKVYIRTPMAVNLARYKPVDLSFRALQSLPPPPSWL